MCQELVFTKESRDLRDESHSLDEIGKEPGDRVGGGVAERTDCKEYISCLTRKLQNTLSTALPFLFGGLKEIWNFVALVMDTLLM